MKKLILLTFTVIALSSCGVLLPRETQKSVLYLDYTPYTEAGFFLSPNEYPGPHTPIGNLNITIDPAVKEAKAQKTNFPDGIYQANIPRMEETIITPEELLETAVREALNKKGTGISNLKIEVITVDYKYYKKGALVLLMPVNRYIISGVVIKTN